MEDVGKPAPRVKLVRHLTDDEGVTLFDKHSRSHRFRIRAWRGEKATPIVIVTPALMPNGQMSVPSRMTSKLANYAIAMVGYPDCNMLYYEQDPKVGENELPLCQVHFEYFGYTSRLRLFKPRYRPTEWEWLETIMGCKIER